MNFNKSIVLFSSNMKNEDRDIVSRLLGIRIATNPKKYLGLSNMVGKGKKAAFQSIKDRMKA